MSFLLSPIYNYGLAGIIISMVIENIGIPLPIEGALLVAQGLIITGKYEFWVIYFVIVFGQVLGSVIAYAIGRIAEKALRTKFGKNKKFIRAEAKINYWYKKYGSPTVFLSRLVGYVRPWSSFVAGIAHFPFFEFLFWTIIGTMIFVYPAMHITKYLLKIWLLYPGLHILISLLLVVLFFGVTVSSVGAAFYQKISGKHK